MVALLVFLNLVIDPFGVFGTSSLPDGPSSNERFLKIDHLAQSPDDYQELIFASSRSGMTDPQWVEERTGRNTYNLSAFSAKPSDMRELYRAYRVSKPAPIGVMIGIDAMAFLVEPEDSDLSRRQHPMVDGAGRLSYWVDYLLAGSFIAMLDKMAASKSPNITFNWERGTYELVGKELEIAKDPEEYRERVFGTWESRDYKNEFSDWQWRQLSDWLVELEDQGVEVKIFLQPMHRQWRERMSSIMPTVHEHLSRIPGMIDLSEMGANDDSLWYEQRHYRHAIAEQVVKAVFNHTVQRQVADANSDEQRASANDIAIGK